MPFEAANPKEEGWNGAAPGWGARLLLALLVLTAPLECAAEGSEALEYKVKAGYLANFAKFVEWPPRSYASGESPFVIGVMGESGPVQVIQEVLRAKTVFGRALEVRGIEELGRSEGCHILFVTRSAKVTAEEALGAIRGAPILLVGETESFAEAGGMIGFVRQDEQFRLLLNLETVSAAGLKASAKLSSVAKAVRTKRGRP